MPALWAGLNGQAEEVVQHGMLQRSGEKAQKGVRELLNHSVLMGRLTRDPELRRTGSGIAVASFRVAVDRDYAQAGQERKTDFFDCIAWRQVGEFVAKYFRKGSMIVVEGRLEQRTWEDREGSRHTSVEINAENVYFGERKKPGGVAVEPPEPAGASVYPETEAMLRRYGITMPGEDELPGLPI